jgi:integrase
MTDLIPLHLNWLRAGGRSPRTVEERQRVLVRAERELPWGLEEAAPDEIAEHFARRKAWKPATRSVNFSHLHQFYRWAVLTGHLTGDPMVHLIRPATPRHVPKPVTEDQLARAMAAPDWLRTAVILAAYPGLRCSEIAAARREDVTADHIRVVGKGQKVAMVDLAPLAWEYLRDRPPGPLVTMRGRQMDGRELTHRQHYWWAKLGLAVTLHCFRHWCATTMLRAGADIRTVQEHMRHASLATTQGYTLVVDAQRRAAVRLLPAPVGHEPAANRLVPQAAEAA